MHYVPGKTIVIVSGNINEQEVSRQISQLFDSVPQAPVILMENIIEDQKQPAVKIFDKATDQTHFIVGFRTFNRFDPRRKVLGVLSTILGHGMSSRLFHRIREELGLCYYIGTSTHLEYDSGVFTIRAGVAHDKVEQAIKETVIILKEIAVHGVTDTELQKAKDFKIGNMYLGLETSDSLADWYGFQEVDQEEILTPEELEAKVRSVTKEEVQEVARDIFNFTQINLAAIGPHKGKEDAWKGLLC
jgi:predicted Zn-dependent peptidase